MSFHEAPVKFCPHRTNIESHVQYAPIGDVQYFEPGIPGDEGAEGDGGNVVSGWFPCG